MDGATGSRPERIRLLTPDSECYHGSVAEFMMDQESVAGYQDLKVVHRAASDGGSTSAKMAPFMKAPMNMMVSNLYGCTAVAVVSEKGVWMAHLFESPSFENLSNFTSEVLNAIRDGDSTLDENGLEWVPALASHAQPGREFDSQFKPCIIIMTPDKVNSQGTGTHLIYGFMVSLLARELQRVLPAPCTTVGYYPIYVSNAFTAKGKFLVQYTPIQEVWPSEPPTQRAMLRVYVGEGRKPAYEQSWIAHTCQRLA